MTYTTHVSDEPLAIIRANEADPNDASLATARFRRLFNEIERLTGLLREVRGGADTLLGKVDLANRIDAALDVPRPLNGGGTES